jgi:predicted nucleic acid-binding protein
LEADDVDDLLNYLCAAANRHQIHFLWRPFLKDPKDEMVLELAVSACCDYIVTYNHRDFLGAETFGVQVIEPAELLRSIGELP